MDRYGGTFGAYDNSEPDGAEAADSFDDIAPHAPPSPVGQDERRMQVRAYNHWAALLGDAPFPDIADLAPETLDDFGPHGVLLDFGGKRGIDDPAIRFIGAKLAAECGGDVRFKRLSDVPGRSLLSRITDHYLQILANKAPIGFEAEFTNQSGAAVLYRGILLPWSSDGETIDFIFGVINWKEVADAATAEALLSAIDAALEPPVAPHTDLQGDDTMDRMFDLSGYPQATDDDETSVDLPAPAFGGSAQSANDAAAEPFELVDEFDEGEDTDEDEDAADASEWGAGFSGFGEEDTVYAVDYGDLGLEDGEYDEDVDDVVDPLSDNSDSLGLASLVARSLRVKPSVVLTGASVTIGDAPAAAPIPRAYEPEPTPEPPTSVPAAQAAPVAPADAPFDLTEAFEARDAADEDDLPGLPVSDLADDLDLDDDGDIFADEPTPTPLPLSLGDIGSDAPDGLYDCLAAARELAQTARSSEDRGRKALYQAVGRAYDFSLEAAANPADYDELLAENGLTVQDRAPMTPIVKLVFGADYDKTRLTEYATVLGYAHRTGVARGGLDTLLARTEGGLKGIVHAERQARKEADGRLADDERGVRASLAKKLRRLDPVAWDALGAEGPEFALVMVRRLPSGEVVVLGEVPEDVPFVEKAARKLLR